MKAVLLAAGLCLAAVPVTPAYAALDLFRAFVGTYGLSTDGGGSTGSGYTVNAFVPAGAVVEAAYLYQATNNTTGLPSVTINGNTVTFGPRVPNATACCSLASARADVTSFISSIINGGPGGTYSFTIGEGSSGVQDGVALAVIYSLPTLPISTVALLDGFASVTGDVTTLNFADPLNPTAPDFFADMRLGIGFSCCGQESTVRVNGTLITENAGNRDDGGVDSNGALITVGGDDDAFSPLLPSYTQDTERYNLAPFITAGSTSITINTANASEDDNIFLAAFRVFGRAGVNAPPPPPGPINNAVPEPGTWAMMLVGFGAVGFAMRRRRRELLATA